jgi:hypothetical protein
MNPLTNVLAGAGLLYFYQNKIAALSESSVRHLLQTWALSLSIRSPKEIASLYADTGVLLGTFAPSFVQGRPLIEKYFIDLKEKDNLQASFGNMVIQLCGDTAIASGDYIFSWSENMATESVPARFSFVIGKKGLDGLVILNHHSSVKP